MKNNKNVKTLEQFKDEHYGKKGTQKRELLDSGYKTFKTDAFEKIKNKVSKKDL